MIDQVLLDILACPVCKGEVKQEENQVMCCQCGRKYLIKEGIPVMLVEEEEK